MTRSNYRKFEFSVIDEVTLPGSPSLQYLHREFTSHSHACEIYQFRSKIPKLMHSSTFSLQTFSQKVIKVAHPSLE